MLKTEEVFALIIMVSKPAKSEVVNVELVDEIQVHEHAEGGLVNVIKIMIFFQHQLHHCICILPFH